MCAVWISDESYASTKLTMKFNDTAISTATGFFWWHDSQTYLVTNWHNVAGRNAITDECLNENLAVPNRIDSSVICRAGKRGDELIRKEISIKWELGEESQWLQHPKSGQIDVVMCPIKTSVDLRLVSIDENFRRGIITEVSDEVFLLGFPLGIDVGGTPIWKRGTLASEPEMDVEGLPILLVDTASNIGMSGSPVIIKQSFGGSSPRGVITVAGLTNVQLVGVYSGRFKSNGDLDAQLGVVWKASVLEEIVRSGHKLTPE